MRKKREKVRLLMRYASDCRRKKCGGECFVIDTYDSRAKYIGSHYLHETDPRKARNVLRVGRAFWKREGYEVLRRPGRSSPSPRSGSSCWWSRSRGV